MSIFLCLISMWISLAISPTKMTLIVEEQNLIKACHLLAKFGVTSVPLQVRLCSDRMEYVLKALHASPTYFLKHFSQFNC